MNTNAAVTDPPPAKKSKVGAKYPDNEPTVKLLDDLSKEITECWKSLGRKLDVEERDIDCIVGDPRNPRDDEKAMQMLKTWLAQGSATYEKLAEALTEVGKGRLAKKVLLENK